MRTLAGDLPWFLPGLAITTVIALAVAGRVARRLRTESWIAFLLLMSVGAVLAATIPPDAGGFSGRPSAPGRCDFGRIGLAPLSQYLHLGDTSLNVILFVPLGLAMGFSVGPRPRPGCLWLSLPCRWPSKPSNRCCRCSDAGARAGMSSTTSSGSASVSRWGCCCQSFERAGPGELNARGAPEDPTHERRQACGDLLVKRARLRPPRRLGQRPCASVCQTNHAESRHQAHEMTRVIESSWERNVTGRGATGCARASARPA